MPENETVLFSPLVEAVLGLLERAGVASERCDRIATIILEWEAEQPAIQVPCWECGTPFVLGESFCPFCGTSAYPF